MVDARSLLDHLLIAGRELAAQGKGLAEQGLGLPQQGPQRDATLSGLKKGALAGGVLGLLLGTKSGRSLTGQALAVGGLAALGGVAYKAYRNWQASQSVPPPPPGTPVDQMQGPPAQARSEALVRAMIAAAKADGHIDDAERARITQQMQRLGLDAQWVAFLLAEIDKPLDAGEVARGADTPEAAAEIYVASLLVIAVDHPDERAYLDRLAAALQLAPDLVRELEAEAGRLG
jgi:uncharacterized membrane protein YebE (DUF533 family)